MHFGNLLSDCLHLIMVRGHREPASQTAWALQVPRTKWRRCNIKLTVCSLTIIFWSKTFPTKTITWRFKCKNCNSTTYSKNSRIILVILVSIASQYPRSLMPYPRALVQLRTVRPPAQTPYESFTLLPQKIQQDGSCPTASTSYTGRHSFTYKLQSIWYIYNVFIWYLLRTYDTLYTWACSLQMCLGFWNGCSNRQRSSRWKQCSPWASSRVKWLDMCKNIGIYGQIQSKGQKEIHAL